MNHLLSVALLLLVSAAPQQQQQNLPDKFYNLPTELRERATLIVTGTYGQGRTPCFYRPDGTRVWFLDSWFAVKKVYRGKVGNKYLNINSAMLPSSEYVSQKLERDHQYLVLLRPGNESMKRIETKEGLGFLDSLRDEEIIAILEL